MCGQHVDGRAASVFTVLSLLSVLFSFYPLTSLPSSLCCLLTLCPFLCCARPLLFTLPAFLALLFLLSPHSLPSSLPCPLPLPQAPHCSHLLQCPVTLRVLLQGEAEGSSSQSHHSRQGLWNAVTAMYMPDVVL